MKDMAFITTVAYPRQRPHFWVRFAKTVGGRITLLSHRRFYWHDYEGGQEEALFWAKDWRNWEYQRLRSEGLIQPRGDWAGGVPACYTAPRSDNMTGKCGVQRHDYKRTRMRVNKDGTVVRYKDHSLWYSAVWIEYTKEEGGLVRRRYRTKNFSINKYGEEGARRLACEARDKAEGYLQSRRHQVLRRRYQQQSS